LQVSWIFHLPLLECPLARRATTFVLPFGHGVGGDPRHARRTRLMKFCPTEHGKEIPE
jgi:hypothetical protein